MAFSPPITRETLPLEAALQLGAAGFRVVWCAPQTKVPVMRGWPKAATSDAIELRDQFARLRADAPPNVGVALGDCELGFVVAIDIDDAERFAQLEAEHGALPPTLRGYSPRGARCFFLAPDDIAPRLKNVTGIGGSAGVDFKAKGGQVLVCPSVHPDAGPNGERQHYSWDAELLPLATLPPAWALALLPAAKAPQWAAAFTPSSMKADAGERRRAEKYLEKAVRAEAYQVAACGAGLRNTTLHTSLCRLLPLAHGLSLMAGHAHVVGELARAARSAGLPDREIAATVASAERWLRESGAVRLLPHRPAQVESSYSDSGSEPAEPPHAATDPDAPELIEDRGAPARIAENVARMLRIYPRGLPRYDEFSDRALWPDGLVVTDSDVLALQAWLFDQPESTRVRASPEVAQAGVMTAAMERKFHPVRDYLRGLTWDGRRRMDRLFADYFGAMQSDYVRDASRCFLIGAVARVMAPGCKLDTMVVLEGKQGGGKSTAISVLGGDWFADSPIPDKQPDCYQVLRGGWLYELAELASLRGRDVERIKAFITSRSDRYRPSYGRNPVDVPRQTVFIGTTNASAYLSDDTGNRRYHPIACGAIDLEALRRDRDQLWAEAMAAHAAGAPWHLVGASAEAQATVTEYRRHQDPWEGYVAAIPAATAALTIGEMLCELGVEPGRQTRTDEMRLSGVLQRAGWSKRRTCVLGVRRWEYYIPS